MYLDHFVNGRRISTQLCTSPAHFVNILRARIMQSPHTVDPFHWYEEIPLSQVIFRLDQRSLMTPFAMAEQN